MGFAEWSKTFLSEGSLAPLHMSVHMRRAYNVVARDQRRRCMDAVSAKLRQCGVREIHIDEAVESIRDLQDEE